MGRFLAPGLAVAAVLLVVVSTLGSGPVSAAARTVVVNDPGDSNHSCATTGTGLCTLRDAMNFANANDGYDTISFDLPGEGVHTIIPGTPLPALDDAAGAMIDGYSEPGALENTLAEGTNASLVIGVDGVFAGATSAFTILDGPVTIRGIVLTRWNGAGVTVAGGQGSIIAGNVIGLTAGGEVLANVRGVQVNAGVAGTRIGGAAAVDRNVISGNGGAGIRLSSADDTTIAGNLIGTTFTGLGDAGNGGAGVEITGSTTDVVVGGTAGNANNIAFNAVGVRIDGDATRNRVIANRIYLNDATGIDLGAAGVTANDDGDHDLGPNFMQNFPELESVFVSGVTGRVLITGRQDSDELSGLNRIDYYIADVTTDGFGEGRTWIGFDGVLPPGEFDIHSGPFDPATSFTAGARITATATTNDGTSEFSANAAVVLNQRPIATAGPDQSAPPKKLVTLAGAGADGDDLPTALTYLWTQTDGKPVTLSDPTAPSPTFTPVQGGIYEFELVVSDGLDTSVAADTVITIFDENPPVATPLTTSAVGGSPRSIRLRASDTEATEFTFKIVDQPQFGSIGGLNESTGVLIYTALTSFSGTDTFTFTAFDGTNTSAKATVTINVIGGVVVDTGILPNATIGRNYHFDIEAEGGNGVYTWTFTGGTLPPGLVLQPNGELAGNATTPGTYLFGVMATDGNGLKAQRTVQVTVVTERNWAFRLFAMFVTTNED